MKSRRWSVSSLGYTLDTARVNAQTICSLNNGKDPRQVDSYDSARALGEALIAPHLVHRYKNITGLHLDIQHSIKDSLLKYKIPHSHIMVQASPYFTPPSKKRSVCRKCREENLMLPQDSRKLVHNLPKPTDKCEKCKTAVCKKHARKYCVDC